MHPNERGRLLVTLPPATAAWVVRQAQAEHRPVSNFLAHIIEMYRQAEDDSLTDLAVTSARLDTEGPAPEIA